MSDDKPTDASKTELTEDDLDGVQGGARYDKVWVPTNIKDQDDLDGSTILKR